MRRTVMILGLVFIAAACGRSDSAGVTGLPSLPATTTTSITASTSTSTSVPASTTSTSFTTTTTLATLQGVELELLAGGFDETVWAGVDPGTGEVIVIERRGRIRTIDGNLRFDIDGRVSSGGERGLLGLAFHPDDPDRFYVNYTDNNGNTVISGFARTDGAMDPGTETKLLEIGQPASNHNGGHLAFGPDGLLYVGMGDGGGANDRFNTGQDPSSRLGSMLRLDPSSPSGDLPYTIPADNPYVDGGGDPLVWATGLRNPWRYTFDGNRLYIADVGQGEWEEVSVVDVAAAPALNFGWPIQEGSECFRTGNCDTAGLVQPVLEYSHGEGCSITGGVVMHDPAIPELDGFYIYGDYCSGFVRGFFLGGEGAIGESELATGVGPISHFGVDDTGAALVVTLNGNVFRITPVR